MRETREIKFRAWDGYSMHNDVGVMFGVPYTQTYGYYEVFSDRSIDDGVIMQYTGLKDKNGKEIYEGDIVSGPDRTYYSVKKPEIHVVEWGAYQDSEYPDCTYGFNLSTRGEIEVIGNIYENPELIAGTT